MVLTIMSLLCSALTFPAMGAGVSTTPANGGDKSAQVMEALKRKHPENDAPSSVMPTEIGGLYEVLSGDQIFYTDETATYFIFNGQLVDLAKKVNITENRKNELLKVDVTLLDPKDAIIMRRGTPNAQRTLIVFSDPACPFCIRLEKEFLKMENIEVRTYLIPRTDAKGTAESIWCSPNKAEAWVSYMTTGAKPAKAICETPFERIQTFASKHGIRGTPTLITMDNRRSGGYRDTDGLESLLANKTN